MAKKKKLRTKSKSQTKSKPVVTALAIPDLPPSTLSGQDEAFCVEFVITQSQCRAAVASGRAPNSGWLLYQREDIRKRIAEITPDVLKTLQSYRVTEHVLNRGRMYMAIEYIGTQEQPHPERGYIDQLHAIELGLEVEKLITRGPGGVNVNAGAHTINGMQVSGATVKESYIPLWQIHKRMKIFAELDAEEKVLNGTATVRT